jgi:predicted NBD/HSP70 family sugar kinase
MNRALILDVIRTRGPLTRPQIAQATGLSKPTVNDVVEALVAAEYVSEDEPVVPGEGEPRRPGPRARTLKFRADVGHVLGIDIGEQKVVALVADLSGAVLATERRRLRHDPAGHRALLAQLEAVADAALAGAGVARGTLRAIGVGTPGVVDPDTGRVTLAPQLPGWEGLELGTELRRRFDCPVRVDNETHMSLLAELWHGAARDVRTALYVQVGIGIGGALLIDGELHRGFAGAAGEIGYLLGEEDREPPRFGAGPFEWAAGGRAYARLGRAVADRDDSGLLRELAGGDPRSVTARTVFDAAARGDDDAAGIIETLAARLGRGIANAAILLNPEVVILGGGVAGGGDALRDPVERELRRHTPVAPRLLLSELGEDSVVLGAVRVAVDMADELIFSFARSRATPALPEPNERPA